MKNTLLTALIIGTTFAASQSFAQEADVEAGLSSINVPKLGDKGYASSIRGINQAGAKAMQKNAVGAYCNSQGCF